MDVSGAHGLELFFLIVADLSGSLVEKSFKHDFVVFDAGSGEIKNLDYLLF